MLGYQRREEIAGKGKTKLQQSDSQTLVDKSTKRQWIIFDHDITVK